jgi:hypothetical protein
VRAPAVLDDYVIMLSVADVRQVDIHRLTFTRPQGQTNYQDIHRLT